jgi:hypothetical protein
MKMGSAVATKCVPTSAVSCQLSHVSIVAAAGQQLVVYQDTQKRTVLDNYKLNNSSTL